jgi:hypothetical protein
MTAVVYTVDVRDVRQELQRLEHAPDLREITALDSVLAELYGLTQMAVHVITGSLKHSGTMDSSISDDGHVWEGEIGYGGPSEGSVHPYVIYAYFEQRRGGAHDFLAPTDVGGEYFAAVILEAVRGDL